MQIVEKSNQLEVTLCYYPANPEEGETDCLTIGVTKLRCSIEATRESEQRNGVYLCLFVCIIKCYVSFAIKLTYPLCRLAHLRAYRMIE